MQRAISDRAIATPAFFIVVSILVLCAICAMWNVDNLIFRRILCIQLALLGAVLILRGLAVRISELPSLGGGRHRVSHRYGSIISILGGLLVLCMAVRVWR
jgi:hypothetical protein